MSNQQLEIIVRRISRGEMLDAIQKLSSYIHGAFPKNSEMLNTGLALVSRFQDYQRKVIEGTMFPEDRSVSLAQITASLLYYVSLIENCLQEEKQGTAPPDFDRNSFQILGRYNPEELRQLIADYKSETHAGRLSAETLYSLGLCYLQLRSYDLAIKQFMAALENSPDEPDYYYYLAVAKLRGGRIKNISLPLAKEVEQQLLAALELKHDNLKVIWFLYILKHEYYFLNGLKDGQPSLMELRRKIQSLEDSPVDAWELSRLSRSINFQQQTLGLKFPITS